MSDSFVLLFPAFGWRNQRQPNDKGCSLAGLRFKGNGATVLVHDHRMRNRDTLARSFAYALRRKKWIKHPPARGFGNPRAGVANANFRPVTLTLRADGDCAFGSTSIARNIADRVRRIDDDVQNGLVNFARQTLDLRQIWIEFSNHFGDVFPFVAANRQRAVNG